MRLTLCEHTQRKATVVTRGLWWDSCEAQPVSPDQKANLLISEVNRNPVKTEHSLTQLNLHEFRQSVFETMRETLCEIYAQPEIRVSPVEGFWIETKSYFDDLHDAISETDEA